MSNEDMINYILSKSHPSFVDPITKCESHVIGINGGDFVLTVIKRDRYSLEDGKSIFKFDMVDIKRA